MEEQEIKDKIKNSEECKILLCITLLDNKAYRALAFKNMKDIEFNPKVYKWTNLRWDKKYKWVKSVFIEYYEEDYLNRHLYKSIKQLNIYPQYRELFRVALENE